MTNLFKLLKILLFALPFAVSASGVSAQVTCVQQYLADRKQPSLGFAPSDVEDLVNKVAKTIGLKTNGILIVPCGNFTERAYTTVLSDEGIQKGEYIFYSPVWVREVIGASLSNTRTRRAYDEAVVLFGHELGHLLNRDFTTNKDLPKLEQETNADRFAGCAAGALAVRWDSVSEFLGRMRGDTDTSYPGRPRSLAAAKEGYDGCRRSFTTDSDGGITQMIKGSRQTFCNDIKLIASFATQDFMAITKPEGDSSNRATTASLGGFEGCSISSSKFVTYSCRTPTVPTIKIATSQHKSYGQTIKSCLGPAWTSNSFDEKTVSYYNPSIRSHIMISLSEGITLTGKNSYYTNLMVWAQPVDQQRNSQSSKTVTAPPKPEGYCSLLSGFAADAKNEFSSYIGQAKKGGRSFGIKSQLPQWSECSIRSLNDDGSDKYISCDLKPFSAKKEADEMLSAITADVAGCIGAGWASQNRTRSDGGGVVEFNKGDGTSVEIRERETLDETWQIILDVEYDR